MKECCEKLKPFTSLFLRLGLGVVFTFHGFNKIFSEGVALGSSWNPYGMPAVMQASVAWGEFLGGIAILVGFLTPLAALGIIIIMLGAIVTVHGKNGFNMMNQGFEYNYVLIMMCLALIASGPGCCSVDSKCCKNKEDSKKEE